VLKRKELHKQKQILQFGQQKQTSFSDDWSHGSPRSGREVSRRWEEGRCQRLEAAPRDRAPRLLKERACRADGMLLWTFDEST